MSLRLKNTSFIKVLLVTEFIKISGDFNSNKEELEIDDVLALQAVTRELYVRDPNMSKYINIMGYNPKYGFRQLDIPYCMYLPQRYKAVYPLWKLKN